MKVFIKFPDKEGSWAKLVDILPRDIAPPPDLVFKYYGKDAPLAALRAVPNTRLIFRRQGHKTFVVIPDVKNNVSYWKIAR